MKTGLIAVEAGLLMALTLCAGCAGFKNEVSSVDKDSGSIKQLTATITGEPVPACDEPLIDQDGDGELTQRDWFIRDYKRERQGKPICYQSGHGYVPPATFDFDQDSLKPYTTRVLDRAIEVLKQYPDMVIEVAGHTDSVGSDAYNQQLSLRRARAAHEYLINHGVSPSQLAEPKGYGERRPIAPNVNEDGSDNPQGQSNNRRIELNPQD